MSKSQNPLYVVTKKGGVVEPVSNIVEGFLKRLGLGLVWEEYLMLIQLISGQLQGWALYQAIEQLLEQIQLFLESLRTPLRNVRPDFPRG